MLAMWRKLFWWFFGFVHLADSGLYPHSGWGARIRYNVPRKLIYLIAKISILTLKHIMHQETPGLFLWHIVRPDY